MKRSALLGIITLLVIVGGIAFTLTLKLEKKAEARRACSGLEFEAWTGCIAEKALENNDASYCWAAGSIFSPWPGQCMDIFSQQTTDEETCNTISKPEPRSSCQTRFDNR